jgi:ubiquinone biosynthesis protein
VAGASSADALVDAGLAVPRDGASPGRAAAGDASDGAATPDAAAARLGRAAREAGNAVRPADPADPPAAAAADGAPRLAPALPTADLPAAALPTPAGARPALVFDPLAPYRGTVRRFFTVYRHVLGLLAGGAVAYVGALPRESRRGLRQAGPRLTALVVRPFIAAELRALPFPVQLRRRLELLGPTYIKFGQILAIREDLLPAAVTRELQNLFDRLPAIPFPEVREIIERALGAPLAAVFAEVSPSPIGRASIAQAHLARLVTGERVVVKVIKPGIAEVIDYDLRLLAAVGGLLERVIPRYTPRQVIAEFASYTRREVDYTFEADNAETFATNFADVPGIAFPRIYREASARDVLTMEFFDGFKPTSERALALPEAERRRVIDLGAQAIVRMLYQDGFFHADLHAGNLMILPGARPQDPVRVGFLDLGMVGRFEERTRRRMLCYFHALTSGDVEGSTRYLADMAAVQPNGDLPGFRRALADLSRRFVSLSRRGTFSIAQLILESVGLGARFGVSFPVEMTLMVKALVTFEGVGRTLDPRLDVAEVSRGHVEKVFRGTFSPLRLGRELLRSAPEMMDLAVQLPGLLSGAFRVAGEAIERRPSASPLAGLRSSILGGALAIAGVVAYVQHAPWWLWAACWLLALLVVLRGK